MIPATALSQFQIDKIKRANSVHESVEDFLKRGGEIKVFTFQEKNIIKDNSPTNNFFKKENNMKEKFIIGSSDAILTVGNIIKAKPELPAIEKQIDENGKTIVAASPYCEAIPQIQSVHIFCISQEVAEEVIARMKDQGFEEKFGGQILPHGNRFRVTFTAATDKPIREAFRACKSKDGYNAPGLALIKPTKPEKPVKMVKESKPKPKKVKKEKSDGWPEEF